MLLSIDRVLQLLAEGKSLEKIAELANVSPSDIQGIIEQARQVILKHDKQQVKSKIIIKKKSSATTLPDKHDESSSDIFDGLDVLSTIPTESVFTMYIDGASKGNPGPAGIGIVIYDNDNRLIAKVSSFIGNKTNNQAEYSALLRALQLAVYFRAQTVKIRSDAELVVKQLTGEYQVSNAQIKKIYDKVIKLKKEVQNFKIEHVMRNFNEKADFLAKKAADKRDRIQ